ncbi:MAG: DUF4870 domain-containing protein [Candidatus Micrarchaeia archaeon]
MANNAKTTGGDGEGIYIITYFFAWLSGLIVFFTAGQNKRLKMHGAQAIILGGVIGVILVMAFIPFIGILIAFLIWIYGMYIGYMAYKGTDVMVPEIGDYAKKLAG